MDQRFGWLYMPLPACVNMCVSAVSLTSQKLGGYAHAYAGPWLGSGTCDGAGIEFEFNGNGEYMGASYWIWFVNPPNVEASLASERGVA